MVLNVAEGVQDIRSLTYRSVVVISCLRDSSGATITAENAIYGAAFCAPLSSRPSSNHLMLNCTNLQKKPKAKITQRFQTSNFNFAFMVASW